MCSSTYELLFVQWMLLLLVLVCCPLAETKLVLSHCCCEDQKKELRADRCHLHWRNCC